jgi:hypothetical protein
MSNMTSILIKKTGGGPESIFSCQGGLRGKMFENHCSKPIQQNVYQEKDLLG